MSLNKEKYLKAKQLVAEGKSIREAREEVGIVNSVWGYYKSLENGTRKGAKKPAVDRITLIPPSTDNGNIQVTLSGSPGAIRSFFEGARS